VADEGDNRSNVERCCASQMERPIQKSHSALCGFGPNPTVGAELITQPQSVFSFAEDFVPYRRSLARSKRACAAHRSPAKSLTDWKRFRRR
jgi:hypothetical protein